MTDRTGIFAGENPFDIARRWLDEARGVEVNDPDAVALSTVDADGMPNVRIVLMRRIEENGFVFFTNYDSSKGREIAASGKAAFVMHWKSLRRQIRVRGRVERENGAIADVYFKGRPLDSRLGAWASAQSNPLASRQALMDKLANMRDTLGQDPARPDAGRPQRRRCRSGRAGGSASGCDEAQALSAAQGAGCPAPLPRRQACTKASRSGLITSGCVANRPCDRPG